MVFRWYGEGNDPIPKSHIKQIPGVEGIVWALHDLPAGVEWQIERIMEVKEQADQYGFHLDVVESVNIHEDIKSAENIRRFLKLVDSPDNGVTLCTGSLGANRNNHLPEMIREFGERIPFAHIRNVRRYENGDFIETSHRSQDGSVDIVEVVKAYHEIGFTGYARPDHGRHIFDEECRPGYGLYDRALGIMYLWGIWDSLEREKRREVDAAH